MSVLQNLSTEYLTIRNPIFAQYENAVITGPPDDTHDIGYYGTYWNGTNTIYTGLYRDASEGVYKFYDELQVQPDVYNGLINTAGLGFTVASLEIMNLTAQGHINCLATTNSTSPTIGSITTAGGIGIALDAWISGLLNIGGNLIANGSLTAINSSTIYFTDNFIPNNIAAYASMKNDGGWFSARKPVNVGINDTPKVPNVALTVNYTANALTITINATAIGSGYYVGWYLRDDTNTQYAKINADTDNGSNHTLILDQGFTIAGIAGTNTYSLFNRRFSGWIWDESLIKLSAYGFPREDTLSTLDPAAIDGSAPEYIDVSVNNLTVNGSVSVMGTINPNPIPTMTLTTAHILTLTEITNYSVIYANPSAPITITLPLLSSLILINHAYRFTIINVSTFKITLAGNGSDTIETKAFFELKKQWDKQTIVTTPFANTWFIQ